jgi:hypothetical protein
MIVVFCRCNSGHFFQGEFCPFDGWSSPETKRIAEVVSLLAKCDLLPTIQKLRKMGLNESCLKRVIIIEFGDPTCVVDAISPDSYVINGKGYELIKLKDERYF